MAETGTDTELAKAVRDCLAGQFALAVGTEQRAVMEVLEHQLSQSANRDKWTQLHEALDTLRALGPTLRERLAAAVRSRIDAKFSPEPDAFSRTAKFSAASLTLVSDDEVQEEIAVGNTTRRLREATGDELYALNQRLAVVMGVPAIADERSPAHPRVFARALLDALSAMAPGPTAKLAAFAAHDPVLLQALAACYRDTNALLAARGVLPEIRRSYGAPQQVPGVRAVSHAMPAGEPPGPEVTPTPAAMPRPAIAPRPSVAGEPAQAPPAPRPAPPATLFDRLIAGTAAPDLLVDELVGAIFARIAADPHPGEAARAQLLRLRPCVLKAALADRSFFTDAGHPLRGLVDAMGELGAAGVARHHLDGRLPEEWLAQETTALLEGGRYDAATFAAARDRLASLAQRHHDVLAEDDAVVRSVRRVEEERAALQDSALEIAHRISSAEIAAEAAAFVYETWRPVLADAHRTAGHGSPRWNAVLATLDDLLWTLKPRATAEERARFESLRPSVRDRLRQGLIHIHLAPERIESRLAELDRLHEELRRSPAAVASAITTTAGLGQGITDDVTATLHISSGEVLDEGLARGAWFEFTEADGSHRRARLNWLSPVQGACVFKEMARNRSFALSVADLRAKRDAGLARPVDGPGIALACIEGSLADLARQRGLDSATHGS